MFKLNETLVKICVLIAFGAVLYGWHYTNKHQAIREAVSVSETRMKEAHDKALKTAQEASERVTGALQDNANKERDKKDDTINRINTKLSVALSELRTRPTRPDTLPEDSGSGTACTARELYREDAEFLTREAARANTVIAERDYYYQQYEEVRNKFNGTTK